jgi:hypothetical protein
MIKTIKKFKFYRLSLLLLCGLFLLCLSYFMPTKNTLSPEKINTDKNLKTVKIIRHNQEGIIKKNLNGYEKNLKVAENKSKKHARCQAYQEAIKLARKKLALRLSQKKAKAKLLSLKIIRDKFINSKVADSYIPADHNIIYAGNLSINLISGLKANKELKLASTGNYAAKTTKSLNNSSFIINLKNVFSLGKKGANREKIIEDVKNKSKDMLNNEINNQSNRLSLYDKGIIALSYANATQYFYEGNFDAALKETNRILKIDKNNPDGLILLEKIERNMH